MYLLFFKRQNNLYVKMAYSGVTFYHPSKPLQNFHWEVTSYDFPLKWSLGLLLEEQPAGSNIRSSESKQGSTALVQATDDGDLVDLQ